MSAPCGIVYTTTEEVVMAKRKPIVPSAPKPCDAWDVLTEIQINGRHVVKGTELKISGERGRFRFMKQVTTDQDVTWIDVYGGKKGAECIRSFRPERIKTVHSKNKTDQYLAQEFKAKRKAQLAEAKQDANDGTE
jgi:hypothetical protein